eukprot:CAMPEP_0174837462 /NCGR_PEP_ID=MMETSP1114-20130205/6763_1 /TAXON_ID=312471 /ORGANISM="Neobodo designis, Strain CCAP 1951/1" /LENGTH=32 /DNA_ID= /DNA_START= /DNA_END= /DNA_ORIENTATION=
MEKMRRAVVIADDARDEAGVAVAGAAEGDAAA